MPITFDELGAQGRVRVAEAAEALLNSVKENNFTPTVISIEKRPKDFTFFPAEQYGGRRGSVPPIPASPPDGPLL